MNTQSKLKKIKGNKQKLKLFRSNDPLKSVLMWGINYSMSQLSHVTRKVVLMDEDFKGYIKAAIENHQFNKEYIPSHYKFKEYAPMVFLDLRRRFNVDDRDYLESLTSHPPMRMKKAGKSQKGSLMFSQDRRYVARIVTADDIAGIQNLLAKYHEHIVQQHGNTLLSHILALYRVTVNDQHTHIIVMRNITYPPGHLSRLYLLEGNCSSNSSGDKKDYSTSGDSQTEGEVWHTFGDNQLVTDEVKIMFQKEDKDLLVNTLCDDMNFLELNKITRYKLLFGLRDIDGVRYKSDQTNQTNQTGVCGSSCPLPICSEEEEVAVGISEGSPGAVDSGTGINDSDSDDLESDIAILSNITGSKIGPFGLRDRSDDGVIYYLGIVDFYRRRAIHHHSGGRKASVTGVGTIGGVLSDGASGGGGVSGAAVGGGGGAIRRDSQARTNDDNSVMASSKQALSVRLLNTITQCMV